MCIRDRYTSAADRIQARAYRAPTGPGPALLAAIDDGSAVGAKDISEVLRALGRAPTANLRATAAAWLAPRAPGLARLLHPAVSSTDSFSTCGEQARADRLRAAADGDSLQALGALRALQVIRADAAVEPRIEALARDLGRFDIVEESLGRSILFASSPIDKAEALAARARVLLSQDPRGAIDDARRAFWLTADPAYATLWRQLAMASGDGEATAEALAAQAAAAGDPATRARALIERAFVLGRTAPQEGLKAIDDALAPPPEGVGVRADLMEARARLLLALHERAGAADALLAAAALVDPQSGVPLRREAANLLVEAGSVDEAVDVLCSGASEHDPTALADAEELARAHGSREILSRVLELRQGEVQDPMQRRLFVLERARVLNDIGDREAARALLEVQAQEDTGDVGVRLLLAEWYLGDRRMLDAALAYESVAVLPGVPLAAQGSAAREAASLLAALGDLERAGPLAQRAIHAGLVNLDLLAVAEAWHRGHERYADVDDLLGRELAHLDDPRRRAHVWMERAAVRRDRLGDLEGATQAVDAALREAPDSAMALESLRDEARRTRDFLPLVRGLSAAADSAHQPERRAELYRELAVFQLDELQDFAAAEDSIARALTVRPDEPASLLLKASLFARAGRLEGASELVRQLEERGFDDLPGALWLLDGDARRQAGDLAGARTRYARATEDGETKDLAWDRLIEIAPSDPERAHTLQSARAATSNRARSLLLLRQEAEQRGRIEDADGAIACLQLILDAEPDDSAALAEIAELLRKRRRLRELTPLWVAHARAGADAAERAHRLVAVACFAYDELGQEAPARALFEEALALVPDEPVALIRLADIAWAAHDDARALPLLDAIWPELWAAMPGERGAVREPAELAFRRARCATGLGHPDARQRLEAVLKAEPRHLEALDMLVKLTRAAGDTAAAAAALGTLAGALSERDDPIRVASVYLEFAEIRAEQGKVDEALAAAEHAFRLDPTSAAVLEAVAIAREAAGQAVNAAEAWRRVAALKSGGERRGALERRARGLGAGGRFADAIDALLELVEETGDPRYRTEAEEVARTSGQPDLLRRLGLRTRTPAPVRTQLEVPPITLSVPPETPAVSPVTAPVAVPGAARNTVSEHTDPMQSAARDRAAVTIQMRANLDDNDPQTALRLVLDALPGGLGDEAARLGLVAAERALAWDSYVAIAEARLKESLAPAEVKTVALGAGRVARDHLMDYDRAAAFLYQAHQADAEDLAVRFELTELYARIPRLASHAVTGILQLLRRAPTDPRFFLLSAELAESQGQQERAWAMKGIAQALSGRGLLAEAFSAPSGPSASQPLDQETLAARLAPTGWNGPLQQIFSLLGVHLEVATGNLPPPPRDARPLIHAAPGAAALVDKVDRLLPGRALQLLVDDVMMPYVAAAGIPQAILPQDALPHETLLLALIARATAVVRFVGVVVEGMPAESDVDLIGLLRGGLLGEGTRDARTELLTSRMRPADRDAALLLAPAALRQPDLAGTRAILIRAADRFALLATGSLLAALSAGPLPGLWKESPQRALGLLQTSQRGLELCAFAARDNVWLLRRQLGIGKSDR